jgi:hypothetical protein
MVEDVIAEHGFFRATRSGADGAEDNAEIGQEVL